MLVSQVTYDMFGNVIQSKGANGRCAARAYDGQYAQLVRKAVAYAGPVGDTGCGTHELVTEGEYDRGLGKARRTVGPNGEVAQVDYDDLGLVIRSWDPSADTPGQLAAAPAGAFDYLLPADWKVTPYVVLHKQARDGATPDVASYHETWSFSDGHGRPMVALTEADPSAGDGGEWIVSGFVDRNKKGSPIRAYRARFWSGVSVAFPFAVAATTPFTAQRYDAFGRTIASYATDGAPVAWTYYHALSQDLWDGADLTMGGAHQGTYASVRKDGHGRTAATTERVKVSGQLESREVQTDYLPTGEPYRISRIRAGEADPPVVRWLRYDSLGRMVLNVEPNTTVGFVADAAADPGSMKAWRYAYNDSGDLVGTSDARGCGANYHYDGGGRLIAEDFSPCAAHHAPYSPADTSTGDGTEAFYLYDRADPESLAPAGGECTVDTMFVNGRLMSVSSRGSKTAASYDGQGRMTCALRKLAKPGAASERLAERYAPRWYVQHTSYDGAGRVVRETTGSRVSELAGAGSESAVTTRYTARGTVRQVGGSYGVLMAGSVLDAAGLTESVTYGDVAATTTAYLYDARFRLRNVETYRGAAPLWSTPVEPYRPPSPGVPSTLQLVLQDYDYAYDEADNPIAIVDRRAAEEWPDGAKPVSRTMTYDDLYRVTEVKYGYPAGSDRWVSPYDAEDRGIDSSPQRAQPSPHVSFESRVKEQRFEYDWLGNTVRTGDDASGFYDRSLGQVTNGTSATGPYQLRSASNRSSSPSSPLREGNLEASYDAAGNLAGLVVRRDGPCLPSGASCSQRFAYEWDEVGRLVSARRWDGTNEAPDAELRYAYNASGDRTLKTAVDAGGNQVHTAYIFGSLELRRARWLGEDYELTFETEVPYLEGGSSRLGRVFYAAEDVPAAASGRRHVFLELADYLNSTAIAIDLATGELVEASSYQAYGAAESDYRPERWKSFREDYKFTGKEDDIEVGLTYFGKRYYAPGLGRWASADPLGVHAPGRADLNLYAYAHGMVYAATDPVGLEILTAILIAAAIGVAIGAGSNAAAQAVSGRSWNWKSFGISVAAGALAGGLAGATAGAGEVSLLRYSFNPGGLIGGAAGGALRGGATGGSWTSAAQGAFLGAGTSAVLHGDVGLGATSAASVGGAVGPMPVGNGVRGTWGEAAMLTSLGGHLGAAAGGMVGLGGLGGVSGAMNGAYTGVRGTYNWSSWRGYFSFGSDSTLSLSGTTLGNVTNLLNTGNKYSDELSGRQNRQVYPHGVALAPPFAFTQGSVIGNIDRGAGPEYVGSTLDHETEHVWQQRYTGPVFQSTYVLWGIGGVAGAVGYSAYHWDWKHFGDAAQTLGYYDNPFERAAYRGNNPGGRKGAYSDLLWE